MAPRSDRSRAPAVAPSQNTTRQVVSTTVLNNKTKLNWQRAISTSRYDWDGARTYCAGLNLGGTGWRVPTRNELVTIISALVVSNSTPTGNTNYVRCVR
jgi:hypothetical protein